MGYDPVTPFVDQKPGQSRADAYAEGCVSFCKMMVYIWSGVPCIMLTGVALCVGGIRWGILALLVSIGVLICVSRSIEKDEQSSQPLDWYDNIK